MYEYFLSKFALAEGKGKGEFYTPKCIVNLLAAMIEPYGGTIYDPCCGSGGMFVQSVTKDLIPGQNQVLKARHFSGAINQPHILQPF